MRQFLAVVMLGGVLAVTASTAFADDTVNGSPRSNALNVTQQDAFQNVNLDIPSPNTNITQVYREGNLGR